MILLILFKILVSAVVDHTIYSDSNIKMIVGNAITIPRRVLDESTNKLVPAVDNPKSIVLNENDHIVIPNDIIKTTSSVMDLMDVKFWEKADDLYVFDNQDGKDISGYFAKIIVNGKPEYISIHYLLKGDSSGKKYLKSAEVENINNFDRALPVEIENAEEKFNMQLLDVELEPVQLSGLEGQDIYVEETSATSMHILKDIHIPRRYLDTTTNKLQLVEGSEAIKLSPGSKIIIPDEITSKVKDLEDLKDPSFWTENSKLYTFATDKNGKDLKEYFAKVIVDGKEEYISIRYLLENGFLENKVKDDVDKSKPAEEQVETGSKGEDQARPEPEPEPTSKKSDQSSNPSQSEKPTGAKDRSTPQETQTKQKPPVGNSDKGLETKPASPQKGVTIRPAVTLGSKSEDITCTEFLDQLQSVDIILYGAIVKIYDKNNKDCEAFWNEFTNGENGSRKGELELISLGLDQICSGKKDSQATLLLYNDFMAPYMKMLDGIRSYVNSMVASNSADHFGLLFQILAGLKDLNRVGESQKLGKDEFNNLIKLMKEMLSGNDNDTSKKIKEALDLANSQFFSKIGSVTIKRVSKEKATLSFSNKSSFPIDSSKLGSFDFSDKMVFTFPAEATMDITELAKKKYSISLGKIINVIFDPPQSPLAGVKIKTADVSKINLNVIPGCTVSADVRVGILPKMADYCVAKK